MKIKYINNKKDNKLYKIFLDVFNIDYKPYETNEVDRLIIKGVIELIDKITTRSVKKY